MKISPKFTPAQVRAAQAHVQALYEDARSEYFSKIRIEPHSRVGDVDELFPYPALLWLELKEDIGEAEIADWIMQGIAITEAHVDIWGPPDYLLKKYR